MVPDTMVLDLAQAPRAVPRLVEGFRQEWPEWCASVSPRELEGLFAGGANGGLPVVLVAMAGDAVQGTIALRPWFAEDAMAQTPWVRQLLVFPEFRGRGVYSRLEKAITRRARARLRSPPRRHHPDRAAAGPWRLAGIPARRARGRADGVAAQVPQGLSR